MLNIFKANTQIQELTNDNTSLLQKCQGFENEIANLKAMSVDMTEKQSQHDNVISKLKEDYEKQISTIKAEYEAKIDDLIKTHQEKSNTVAEKAADVIASLGIDPDAIKVTPKEVVVEKPTTYKVISYINNKTESK